MRGGAERRQGPLPSSASHLISPSGGQAELKGKYSVYSSYLSKTSSNSLFQNQKDWLPITFEIKAKPDRPPPHPFNTSWQSVLLHPRRLLISNREQ